MQKNGTLYYKITLSNGAYWDELSISTYDLPQKETIIDLPTLPITLNEYNYSGKLESTFVISDITYEMSGSTLYLYFAGSKTYDSRGAGQSDTCKISWKLYDMDGYVFDSGTAYSTGVAMGEKFRNVKDYVWDAEIGGHYKLVILSTSNGPD